MGVSPAIFWDGCVSVRESHPWSARIARSQRDEAIRALESTQLSPSVSPGPALQGRGAPMGDYDMGDLHTIFCGGCVSVNKKQVRDQSQPFLLRPVYIRIGFVSVRFTPGGKLRAIDRCLGLPEQNGSRRPKSSLTSFH